MKPSKWDGFEDFFLGIGISHVCPMDCVMCGFNHKNEPVNGNALMSITTWERIFQRLADERIHLGSITPLFWGESTIHPQFPEFLSIAAAMNKKHGIYGHMGLCTSGVFITRKFIKAILDGNGRGLHFRSIVIGLDADTKETYYKIRRKGNFERVVENIKTLIQEREIAKAEFPKVSIEFLFQTPNLHEAEGFVKSWRDYFSSIGLPLDVGWDQDAPWGSHDSIFIKRAHVPDPNEQIELTRLHKETVMRLGLISKDSPSKILRNDFFEGVDRQGATQRLMRKPCPALWRMLMINPSGIVTTCCNDMDSVHSLGNINTDSFSEIWYSEAINRLRIANLLGNFVYSPVCGDCKNQEGVVIPKEYYIKYLVSIGREDLLPQFESRFSNEVW
jgi:radical SAM protein with 4Fe4S-binding SPASM domain